MYVYGSDASSPTTPEARLGFPQGFAAEVPEEYLSQLKSLHAAEIDYIGALCIHVFESH